MNIVSPKYNLDLKTDGNVLSLTIENGHLFSDVLHDIWDITENASLCNDIILSSGGERIILSKSACCIFNPFSLDFDNKKISSSLAKELKIQADEAMWEESLKLNSEVVNYIDKLISLSEYNIDFETDWDILGLLKLYKVAISPDCDSLAEKVIDYMKVMHRLCGVYVFFFLNFKDYFSYDKIKGIYEFCSYEDIFIVILESHQGKKFQEEKSYIIDDGLCLIALD